MGLFSYVMLETGILLESSQAGYELSYRGTWIDRKGGSGDTSQYFQGESQSEMVSINS
jgi:hypothetical protein